VINFRKIFLCFIYWQGKDFGTYVAYIGLKQHIFGRVSVTGWCSKEFLQSNDSHEKKQTNIVSSTSSHRCT
jgi:hypothetical protein